MIILFYPLYTRDIVFEGAYIFMLYLIIISH